jgi:2-phospho-L-lactate guanylyltransferase
VEWTVLVPVKQLGRAKSRLRGGLPGVPHRDLVLALVLDTLSAVVACPAVAGVMVVSSDETVAAAARDLGAKVLADVPDSGINPALVHAAGAAGAGPLAALAGDLPALRGDELAAALAAATTVRGYVRDTAGTGTTLLAAPAGVALDPRFGIDSARAHQESGAVELTGRWPSLRLDVDTAADFAAARGLGLGARTAAIGAIR